MSYAKSLPPTGIGCGERQRHPQRCPQAAWLTGHRTSKPAQQPILLETELPIPAIVTQARRFHRIRPQVAVIIGRGLAIRHVPAADAVTPTPPCERLQPVPPVGGHGGSRQRNEIARFRFAVSRRQGAVDELLRIQFRQGGRKLMVFVVIHHLRRMDRP